MRDHALRRRATRTPHVVLPLVRTLPAAASVGETSIQA